MKSYVLLRNKLPKLSQVQIEAFLDELNHLSFSSVCGLSNSDTYFIRKKVGVYNNGESICDKDLASLYELTIQDLREKEKQLFQYVSDFLISDALEKLKKKVNDLEEKRAILSRVNMVPESYIEISELNLSDQAFYLLSEMHIKTVFDLCGYSFIDLLKQEFINMEVIKEICSKLNYIGYSLKNDYSDYSYEELLEILPLYAGDIKNYVHNLGFCLKGEDFSDIVSIEILGLSARSLHTLKKHNIYCIGDLRSTSKDEIMNFRNLGVKSIMEIYEKLDEFNSQDDLKSNVLIKK